MVKHTTSFAAMFLTAFLGLTPLAYADDAKPPLPMPDDASDVTYDGAGGSLNFSSAKPVKAIAGFYRDLAKQHGWKEQPSVINKDNMAVLTFTANDDDVANITVMRMGDQSQVTAVGSAFESKEGAGADAKTEAKADDAPAAPVPAKADLPPLVAVEKHGLPMPDGMSSSINEFNDNIKLSFIAPNSVADIVAFYRTELAKKEWKETAAKVSENEAALSFTTPKGPARLTVKRNGEDSETELALGPDAAAKVVDASGSTALVATEKNGLPLPDGLGNNGSSATQFSKAVNFSAPNSVADIVAFYRAELAKKGWKEDAAKVDEKAAELSFTAPEGPAKLVVTRNGDMSDAELTLTQKSKAAASPLAPKPGMVKLVFGNMSDKPADVTIAGKHVKMKPGQGAKGPDGPTLEVKPGKLSATMKGAQAADFEAGPDEIWMVGVGPGGLIAIKQ